MKAVAWGYVTRDNGNGKEVLVTERYKEDDPLRSGQLAIPGGKLGPSEWYHQAAIREVLEETGIETELEDSGKFNSVNPGHFNNANVSGVVAGKRLRLVYRDSKKSYFGEIYDLKPRNPLKDPESREGSDAKNPRYMALSEMLKRRGEFTPACQVLVDIIKEAELL